MRSKDFEELVESVKQAGKIKRGELKPSRSFEFKPADIKSVREKKLRVSQSEFALMIGVSVSTLQNWEQGRRHPEGPARALLESSFREPQSGRGRPEHLRCVRQPDNHPLQRTSLRLAVERRRSADEEWTAS